jgi:hypothetical protein
MVIQQVFSTRCRNVHCKKTLTGFELKKGFCTNCRAHSCNQKMDSILCVLCDNILSVPDTKNNHTKFCPSCAKSRIRIKTIRRNKDANVKCIFRSGYCKLCKCKMEKNSHDYYNLFCSNDHRNKFNVYKNTGIVWRLLPRPCEYCGKITPKIKYSYKMYCNRSCFQKHNYRKWYARRHGN